MRNVINWFEIPVSDIARAAKFYGTILDVTLDVKHGADFASAMFPHNGGVGGGLVAGEGYVPHTHGPIVYLNAHPNLDTVLRRVEVAGGQVLKPRTDIGEDGFFALILDTEGNRVALHSMN